MVSRMPSVSKELIEYLYKLYPDTCPNFDVTEKEIYKKIGEIGVVRHLKRLLDEQMSNVLGNK